MYRTRCSRTIVKVQLDVERKLNARMYESARKKNFFRAKSAQTLATFGAGLVSRRVCL